MIPLHRSDEYSGFIRSTVKSRAMLFFFLEVIPFSGINEEETGHPNFLRLTHSE